MPLPPKRAHSLLEGKAIFLMGGRRIYGRVFYAAIDDRGAKRLGRRPSKTWGENEAGSAPPPETVSNLGVMPRDETDGRRALLRRRDRAGGNRSLPRIEP